MGLNKYEIIAKEYGVAYGYEYGTDFILPAVLMFIILSIKYPIVDLNKHSQYRRFA